MIDLAATASTLGSENRKVQTIIVPEESFENAEKLLALVDLPDLASLIRESVAAYTGLCARRKAGAEFIEWNPTTLNAARVMFSFDARIGTPMPRLVKTPEI
jgi:hypothetical protein